MSAREESLLVLVEIFLVIFQIVVVLVNRVASDWSVNVGSSQEALPSRKTSNVPVCEIILTTLLSVVQYTQECL